MSDPFSPETNHQIMREARAGLAIIAVMLGLFVYVAYYKISGQGVKLPEHVLNAPIAERVWPNSSTNRVEVAYPSNAADVNTRTARTEQALKDIPTGHDRYQDPLPERNSVSEVPSVETIPRPSAELKETLALQRELRDQLSELKKLTQQQNQVAARPNLPPIDMNALRNSKAITMAENGRKQNQQMGGKASLPIEVKEEKDDSSFASSTPTSDLPAGFVRNSFAPRVEVPDALAESNSATKISSSWPDSTTDSRTTSLSEESSESTDFAGTKQSEFLVEPPVKIQDSVSPVVNHPQPAFGDVARGNTSLKSIADSGSELVAEKNPSAAKQLEYAVKSGDSFWAIAQSVYGDGRYFRALFKQNEKSLGQFQNLVAGMTIQTPPLEDLRRLWPAECPQDAKTASQRKQDERYYVTRKGDTLFEIARQQLGQASRYLDLYRLNELRLPAKTTHLSPLPAELRLILPAE